MNTPRFIEMSYEDFRATVSACLKGAFIQAMKNTDGPSDPAFSDVVVDYIATQLWELVFSTAGLQGWKPPASQN